MGAVKGMLHTCRGWLARFATAYSCSCTEARTSTAYVRDHEKRDAFRRWHSFFSWRDGPSVCTSPSLPFCSHQRGLGTEEKYECGRLREKGRSDKFDSASMMGNSGAG